MWPAKLPGEDAALVDACSALCQSMIQLGVAVDGGKDSLSMAARAGSAMIKAPSTVVLSALVNQLLKPFLAFAVSIPPKKTCLILQLIQY